MPKYNKFQYLIIILNFYHNRHQEIAFKKEQSIILIIYLGYIKSI